MPGNAGKYCPVLFVPIIAVEADELMGVIREAVEQERRAKLMGNNNAAKEKTECQLIDTSFQAPERVTSKAAALFNTNRTYVYWSHHARGF